MGLEQIAVERQLKCEEVLSMISQSSESTHHHSGQASFRFEEGGQLLFTIPLFTALGQLVVSFSLPLVSLSKQMTHVMEPYYLK